MNAHPSLSVGLVSFAASWFSDIGHERLTTDITGRTDALRGLLQKHYHLVDAGVVTAPRQALDAGLTLRQSSVDVVLLVFPAWSEDDTLLAFMRSITPTPIWFVDLGSYLEMPLGVADQDVFFGHTELVGLLQATATASRACSSFRVLKWRDGADHADGGLVGALRALAALKFLSSATVGLIPSRTTAIRCATVDELAMARTVGCRLEYLSICDLADVFQRVPDDRVQDYIRTIEGRATGGAVPESQAFLQSVKLAYALRTLAEERSLDALAIDDLSKELHATFGLRPCLIDRQALINCPPIALEGDVSAAVSMIALERLGCEATALVEPFFCVASCNAILFGHAGGCDPRLGESGGTVIEPDLEYKCSTDRFPGSPSLMVTGRPGVATLVALQISAAAQRVVGLRCKLLSHKRRLPGYSEFLVQFEHPCEAVIDFMMHHGCSQHFVLGSSDVCEQVLMLGEMTGLGVASL